MIAFVVVICTGRLHDAHERVWPGVWYFVASLCLMWFCSLVFLGCKQIDVYGVYEITDRVDMGDAMLILIGCISHASVVFCWCFFNDPVMCH